MTLTEFLNARLDEDEAVAREAHYDGQRWYAEEEVVNGDVDYGPTLVLDRKCDALHSARWSPARVLAEVEAKRRIVEQETSALSIKPGVHPPEHEVWFSSGRTEIRFTSGRYGDEGPVLPTPDELNEWWDTYYDRVDDTPTPRLLALPFSDHPDYDEAWRP